MSKLILPNDITKTDAFSISAEYLTALGLETGEVDDTRPWGGYFVINEASTEKFIDALFPELDRAEIYKYGKALKPKLMLIAPGEKFSWQYHNKRAEVWKVVTGPVGVLFSDNDTPPPEHTILLNGEIVAHADNVRHRLIGLKNWGAVAEIWQHTDPNEESVETDVVRIDDIYGRN